MTTHYGTDDDGAGSLHSGERETCTYPDCAEATVLCVGCIGFDHCDGRQPGCDCTCGLPPDWADPQGAGRMNWLRRGLQSLTVAGPSPALEEMHREASDGARLARERKVKAQAALAEIRQDGEP